MSNQPIPSTEEVFCHILIYIKELDPPPQQLAEFIAHQLKFHLSAFDATVFCKNTVYNKNYMRRYAKNIVLTLLSMGKSPRYIADLLQININTVYYHQRNPNTRKFVCTTLDEIRNHSIRELLYTKKQYDGDYATHFDRPVYDKFLVTDYKLIHPIPDSEKT